MKYLKFIDMWGIKPLLGALYMLSLRARAGRDLSDPAVFSEVVLPMMVVLVVAVVGYILHKRGLLGEFKLR